MRRWRLSFSRQRTAPLRMYRVELVDTGMEQSEVHPMWLRRVGGEVLGCAGNYDDETLFTENDTLEVGDECEIRGRYGNGPSSVKDALLSCDKLSGAVWKAIEDGTVVITSSQEFVGGEATFVVTAMFNHWGDDGAGSAGNRNPLVYAALTRATHSVTVVEPNAHAMFGEYYDINEVEGKAVHATRPEEAEALVIEGEKTIPESALGGVTSMDLSGRGLLEVPPIVWEVDGRSEALKELDLRDNPGLVELPMDMSGLT